jgi:DNA-binding beta-propeller fold protein YncE
MRLGRLIPSRLLILPTIALALLAIGAAPIPAENRIVGSITRTIESPAKSPLVMPTDVAIDALGYVYVADGVNDRIVRFTPPGALDAVLTGPQDSPLSRPIGVAIDRSGALWIADTGNHRLLVRSAEGRDYKTIALPPADKDKPADPTGIIVRADGARTYVADCNNHRVLVLNNASGAITPLGEWGISLGQFRWPFMLCMGPEDHVVVSESVGARLQLISADNRWAGQIGHFGVVMGSLYRPKGVASDATGRIFVADSSIGVIQAFNDAGKVLGVLTDDAGQPLRFDHPMGMRFDSAGALYVVELGANRVAVVTLKPPTTQP